MAADSSTRDVANAFAPGNISGLFKIIAHDDPAKMHSLGWGFTVSDGVNVKLTRSTSNSTQVTFNDGPIDFPTVSSALHDLTDVNLNVDIASNLPLSSGFGLSGAATFAALIAADSLLDLGKSRNELAMIAHVAEVKNLTGLGDVCSQYNGGCLVKTTVGHPLAATTFYMPPTPVYWRYFSKIRTSEILADHERHKRINQAADEALTTIENAIQTNTNIAFEELIALALDFAQSSGLLMDDRVKNSIAQANANGGVATMIMLGNAVFSTAPFPGCTETMLSGTAAHLIED